MSTNVFRTGNRSGRRKKFHLTDSQGETFCPLPKVKDCNMYEVHESELDYRETNWCLICAMKYVFGVYPNNEIKSEYAENGLTSALELYQEKYKQK